MSIGLQIEKINNKTISQYQPIATEQFFSNYWKPISKKLNLEWINQFDFGVPFNGTATFIETLS